LRFAFGLLDLPKFKRPNTGNLWAFRISKDPVLGLVISKNKKKTSSLYAWEDPAMEAFHIFDLPGLIGLCAGSQIWKASIVGPSLIQISSYYCP
jgi:hypothetical protein